MHGRVAVGVMESKVPGRWSGLITERERMEDCEDLLLSFS